MNCDVFVLLDDVQFKKNEWQNRNRIKTATGWQWITVPVIHNFGQKIIDVKINNRVNWRRKHMNALIANYSKAPYFKKYRDFFEETYQKEWEYLCDINIHFILFIAKELEIEVPIIRSSTLGVTSTRTQRLIDICKKVGADTYLSGIGGYYYLDFSLFEQKGIKLIFQDFKHPVYPQLYGEFIPNLSVVDALFNCGKDLRKFLMRA